MNRKTGELQINVPVWEKLSKDQQRFVELHEEGHLVLQTTNELAADRYAFDKYAKEGHSLKTAVKTLTGVLQNKPTHLLRSYAVLKQAENFQKNNNMSQGNVWITQAWDNFLGVGKKAKQKREERKEVRQDRREARQERREEKKDLKLQKRQDRNERKNTLAEARAEQKVLLAEKGQSAGGQLTAGIGNAIGNIGSTVASVASGGLSGALTGMGIPPAAPYTNLPSPSLSEVALSQGSSGTSFQQSYESDSGAERTFANDHGMFSSKLSGNKKNLPWIIGGVLVVIVVITLIIKKK